MKQKVSKAAASPKSAKTETRLPFSYELFDDDMLIMGFTSRGGNRVEGIGIKDEEVAHCDGKQYRRLTAVEAIPELRRIVHAWLCPSNMIDVELGREGLLHWLNALEKETGSLKGA